MSATTAGTEAGDRPVAAQCSTGKGRGEGRGGEREGEQRPATDPSLLSVRQVRGGERGGEGRGRGTEARDRPVTAECSTGKGRGNRGPRQTRHC